MDQGGASRESRSRATPMVRLGRPVLSEATLHERTKILSVALACNAVGSVLGAESRLEDGRAFLLLPCVAPALRCQRGVRRHSDEGSALSYSFARMRRCNSCVRGNASSARWKKRCVSWMSAAHNKLC